MWASRKLFESISSLFYYQKKVTYTYLSGGGGGVMLELLLALPVWLMRLFLQQLDMSECSVRLATSDDEEEGMDWSHDDLDDRLLLTSVDVSSKLSSSAGAVGVWLLALKEFWNICKSWHKFHIQTITSTAK